MSEKKSKIVMITMFKNEARSIKRMLDSCLPYVDYYVMQDNGSTDGTNEIAKQFLLDNKLSGEIYVCEEGWKGFGWNRDHLIQYCQGVDHGCDWILKMDCDEILEVDSDFDWSPLDNKSIQSFHIPAVLGNQIYYRAWMYNAKLPWRFNHDPCHETVYCDIEGIKENFVRYDLPNKIRQIGFNEGQSWEDPHKFISHALVLEEKMIKEGTMLSNLYHFWYVGKSYFDAYQSNSFPLGVSQQKEYARRSLYYFDEYLNISPAENSEDETRYITHLFQGSTYEFLGQEEDAIVSYSKCGKYAPSRNDHLFMLAWIHHRNGRYKEMLECTTLMMQPERTNPFPRYISYIDPTMYIDSTSGRVQGIHQLALDSVKPEQKNIMTPFFINKQQNRRLFVVDNFYQNPDEIRNFALQQEYKEDLRYYKGLRTPQVFQPLGIKESFESIIGQKITNFDLGGVNGCFQLMMAKDPQVYHYDFQKWAAMIYLTPNAPIESGTRLHRSRLNGVRHSSQPGADDAFAGNFYDSTKFDITDAAANIYNRLVIMDAGCIHSAGPYFGDNIHNGRLTHLFFFD